MSHPVRPESLAPKVPMADDAARPPAAPPALMPELACYGLAGHSASPADLIAEAARAEELGLGSILLSERFALKDAAVMAGAAVAATSRIGVGTAATNHNTRHPLVTATMATTLHRMSGGRYAFGPGFRSWWAHGRRRKLVWPAVRHVEARRGRVTTAPAGLRAGRCQVVVKSANFGGSGSSRSRQICFWASVGWERCL
ncbi:LLM class flavin-dependent oxidoreductase, partial [Dietzia kunjamensis]|uniref:LLM class flavin-dependent oxidoreductase n=1 Tax=Dietzia kunjamensis TaxID=322509 RepID=UPI0024B954CF